MRKLTYTVLFIFTVSGALLAKDSISLKKSTSQKQVLEKPYSDKIASERLNQEMISFVDLIIADIPQNRENLSVAIPAFDRLDDDRIQRNINFVFIDMLRSRLEGTKKYRILNPNDVADVQDDLDLDVNNLYDSEKKDLLGETIKADFLIVGKLKSSKDKSIEMVTVKVIDVKKESTFAEKTGSFDRKILGKVTSDILIQSGSYDFLPPSFKFILGAEYFRHYTTTHFKDKPGDMGFVLGVNYDQNKRHSYQFLTSFLFSQADAYKYNEMTFENPIDETQTLLSRSSIRFTKSRSYQIGYGYIFRSFRKVYMRPSIFLGHSHVDYEYEHAGYNITNSFDIELEYPSDGKLKNTASYTSDYVNATVDALINYNSRVSYFVSFGYKFMSSLFMDSWSAQTVNGYGYSGMYDAIISGVTMRAGVSVYL